MVVSNYSAIVTYSIRHIQTCLNSLNGYFSSAVWLPWVLWGFSPLIQVKQLEDSKFCFLYLNLLAKSCEAYSSLYIHTYININICIFLSTFLSLSLSLCLCLSVSLSLLYVFVYLSACLPVCLCACVCLCVCLSVSMSLSLTLPLPLCINYFSSTSFISSLATFF